MRVSSISLWIILNIFIFLVVCFFYPNSMFSAEGDGFYWQIFGENEGDVLMGIHDLRRLVVYPFFFMAINKYPLLLSSLMIVIYLIPIFFLNIPKRLKSISVICLYLCIFLSYRTVLVNVGVYILVCSIIFGASNKYIFYALLLSSLSSGVLGVALLLIFFNSDKFFSSVPPWIKPLVFMIVVFFMSGSIMHKTLFFYDSSTYGSASSVSINDLEEVNISTIISNIYERGVLHESFLVGDKFRMYMLFANFLCLLALSILSINRKVFFRLLIIYICFLFFEGLGAHSFTLISICYFSFFCLSSLLHDKKNNPKQSYP